MLFAIALALIGALLIYFEFFIPGGVIGMLGAVAVLAGMVFFFQTQPKPVWIAVYIAANGLLVFGSIRFALSRLRASSKENTLYSGQDQEGFYAATFKQDLIGKKGTVVSTLRPAGHIIIEGERYQAVSRGSYIEDGMEVEVIGGEGARLIVKKIMEKTS